MRIVRTICNKVGRENLVEQTVSFRNVQGGTDRTRKRAVDEKIILRLFKLDLQDLPVLSLVRPLFIFQLLYALAFFDMAFLHVTDICYGTIRYVRHKTKQRLSIRIEPNIQ